MTVTIIVNVNMSIVFAMQLYYHVINNYISMISSSIVLLHYQQLYYHIINILLYNYAILLYNYAISLYNYAMFFYTIMQLLLLTIQFSSLLFTIYSRWQGSPWWYCCPPAPVPQTSLNIHSTFALGGDNNRLKLALVFVCKFIDLHIHLHM